MKNTDFDWKPLALVPVLALIALPLTGSVSTWLTLTVAGLGGVMWGLYQQNVVPQMGAQVNVLIFIVIIIGGLGSTGGALIGALLVGLMANYTGFLVPKVALFSNIALMVAILLWRPQGVYPVANR